ncbi:hypothetical protein TNCT_116461 [Trichonephila clavata]|uniref:Uncharacterized protein n=1 Tax=Trichonephila clavata TaxID=2740835 RepID=A0A8X6EYA7_TRICU|nr:hypothetical protein TNCT_116461 [Trichonephila clavata]
MKGRQPACSQHHHEMKCNKRANSDSCRESELATQFHCQMIPETENAFVLEQRERTGGGSQRVDHSCSVELASPKDGLGFKNEQRKFSSFSLSHLDNFSQSSNSKYPFL